MKIKNGFAIFCGLFMAAVFLFIGGKQLVESKRLADHGKVTTGQVVQGEDHVIHGLWSSHTYYLDVKFQAENAPAEQRRIEVTKAVYEGADIGGKINVFYLPDAPGIYQAGDAVEIRYHFLVWGFVFLAGTAFLKMNSKHVQTLTLDQFEYVSVNARDFKHLDLSFYDELQRELERKGFRFLDDQENVTLRRRNGVHTFVRVLLDKEGTTMAAIYHFVPRPIMRLLGAGSAKVLDLETRLSDGSFVCTSNAESAGKINSPPRIRALYLPAATTWDILLESHRRRLDIHLGSHPDLKPTVLKSMDDVRRVQDEQQRIKSEFRKRYGVTQGEFTEFNDRTANADEQFPSAFGDR